MEKKKFIVCYKSVTYHYLNVEAGCVVEALKIAKETDEGLFYQKDGVEEARSWEYEKIEEVKEEGKQEENNADKDGFHHEIKTIYIDGYWIDNKKKFTNYKCIVNNDFFTKEELESDLVAFYYFENMEEVESFKQVENKTDNEFVITKVREV